ncbi:FecR domain-containing protein [uncultured Formosa sp.]|uniref:FecR family protein n=1 Tax=uncultured Formosa sp. TaxID=255435 RepID=UPI0026037747|nr:FecR domain-containing protein [uncultured Formosa sp.]
MKDNGSNKVKILPITKLEKVALKNKIFNSVNKVERKKRSKGLAMAVTFSMLFLVGLSFYFFNEPTTSITDVVNTNEATDFSKSDEVVLILGDGENLKINEKDSNINYSNSGKTLTIGEDREIEQEASRNSKTSYNTLIIPYGKRSKINLSDGTMVWLNSGSKLVYPVAFNGDRREIYLEGEAIFDVAHDKSHPFIVKSKDQEVQVLGTVFGVTSYSEEDAINTVLKSGSVMISYHNDPKTHKYADKIKITPGTKATYNKTTQGIISEKVNVNNYFSWRDGVLVFQNNDLRYVTNRIARYYNVKIEIENEDLAKESFSGYLDLNEDIDKVIQNIQASTNMNYTIKENRIIIN